MTPTLVILVVGLTPRLVGGDTPRLAAFAAGGGLRPLRTVTPAVTCPVQATLTTGLLPSEHGVVANGWYFRELCEPLFWRQPEALVWGEKIWEAGRARHPNFTCAKMFWWFNMYSTADIAVTPRPMYPADGRKIPDHYAKPTALHDELDALLGPFPLFRFWGPRADIISSAWIAKATLHVMATRRPTLTMTYLPHLDYELQRLGPDPAEPRLRRALTEVDALCGRLIDAAAAEGRRVIVVSEYGVTPARGAIAINRALRGAGLVAVRREEGGRETLDCGASAAFALADHQIAHVHVADPARIGEVATLIAGLDGVEAVWGEAEKRANGLDHPRSGELVALARADHWFAYQYWLDDARAPDFARTVDIHRKPGYDPAELFFDPALRAPALSAAWRLGLRKLGFRRLMDVIPADANHLVRGTHGRPTDDPEDGPLVISSTPDLTPPGVVEARDFKGLVLRHVFD